MIGQTLGHYRIIERIGAGGMGEVYRAADLVLGRKVAIKVLRPEILGDSSGRSRFLREARTIAVLSHPNIAVLYEAASREAARFWRWNASKVRRCAPSLPLDRSGRGARERLG